MTVTNVTLMSSVKQLAGLVFEVDVHARLRNLFLLAEEGLEMRFPEVTVYGFDGFKDWYERVIGIFFDKCTP